MQYFETLRSWQRKKKTKNTRPLNYKRQAEKQKETKRTKEAKCYYYLIKLVRVAF